jgi:pyruvate-formate lyase-activating enzyme
MKRVLPTVSISTALVILTLPTFHSIRASSRFSLFGQGCGFPCSGAMDHLIAFGVIA